MLTPRRALLASEGSASTPSASALARTKYWPAAVAAGMASVVTAEDAAGRQGRHCVAGFERHVGGVDQRVARQPEASRRERPAGALILRCLRDNDGAARAARHGRRERGKQGDPMAPWASPRLRWSRRFCPARWSPRRRNTSCRSRLRCRIDAPAAPATVMYGPPGVRLRLTLKPVAPGTATTRASPAHPGRGRQAGGCRRRSQARANGAVDIEAAAGRGE